MQKKIIYGIACGLSLAVSTSCSDDLADNTGLNASCVIEASISNAEEESRSAIDPASYIGGALGILWTPADTIGVFSQSQGNVAFLNQSHENKGRTQFTGDIAGEPLYAYFPWSAANTGRAVTDLLGNLQQEQHWSMERMEIAGDYKYGVPRPNVEHEFNFTHLFSLLKVQVDVTGTPLSTEKLRSVEIIAGDDATALSGEFSFNATNGDYRFSKSRNSVKLLFDEQPQMNQGVSFTGYLSCAPSVKAGDPITISVTTDRHQATFGATSLVSYEAGVVYNFIIRLRNHADGLTVTDVVTPSIGSFGFMVADNPGKILDRKVVATGGGSSASETAVTGEELSVEGLSVSGMIPYLYDFTLVPTFSMPEGCKAYVGGVEQISGETEVDFTAPVEYTVKSPDGSEAVYTVSVSNTGLPVMVINQSSATTAPSVKFVGDLKLREKEASWVGDDDIALYDVNGKYTLAPQKCGVRLRGNSTRNMPKKPLAIKLVKKAAIGDMPKHKRWVLLANWLDNSMIRNNVAFEVAHATERAWQGASLGQGLVWNPHGTNVELVVDGRHVGNYFLCEQIKIDSNRLDINPEYADCLEDGLSTAYADCGYLMECDDNYDEAYKFVTSARGIPFMLKDDANTVPTEYFKSLQTKINSIESNLKNGDYTAAYADLDINSVIDQWIVFELTMNDEFKHPKSVYMYMNGGDSKLCAGPVWDFDWQTFPNNAEIKSLNSRYGLSYTAPAMTEWLYSHSSPVSSAYGYPSTDDTPYMWYPYLFKDEAFRTAVQTRWTAIYPQLQAVVAYIRQQGALNAESWTVDHAMWPTAFNRSQVGFSSCFNGDEAFATYDEVVDNLAAMYQQRLDWMNTAIAGGNFVTNAK